MFKIWMISRFRQWEHPSQSFKKSNSCQWPCSGLARDHPIDNGSFESSSSDSDRPLILTGGTLTPVSTPASPVSPRPLWDVRATSLSQFDLQRNGGHDSTHAARNDPNIYEFDMESGGWRQIANMRTRRGSQWRLQIGDDKALLQKW